MKTILITGTSTGIGLAAAVSLGRAGHHVFATMRNPSRSPELRTLAEREHLPITILPLDVDDDTSVAAAVRTTLGERGHIEPGVIHTPIFDQLNAVTARRAPG